MRDEFSRISNIQPCLKLSGVLISLVDKGILARKRPILDRLSTYLIYAKES
jgi:hypothetical protein